MNETQERLIEIERNGYQIDFATVFNHAFENYKKIALYAGLVIFICSVLFTVLIVVSLTSLIGITTLTKEFSPETFKFETLSDSNILALGGISLVISCLFSPFQAAFLKMAHHGDRDEAFHISDLFSYYKPPYLKEIVVSTVLISAISFVQTTLFSRIHFEFLGTIIAYFISFITILSAPLIIFGNLNAIDAIKYSIVIVFKQPIVLLGLIVVAIIASMVGIIGCCIGIFFTLPFLYSMVYVIYFNIVGIDSAQNND